MRLTKGQLKQIIREEYSKLKRRGLIRENSGGDWLEMENEDPDGAPIRAEIRPGLFDEMISLYPAAKRGDEESQEALWSLSEELLRACAQAYDEQGIDYGPGAPLAASKPRILKILEFCAEYGPEYGMEWF